MKKRKSHAASETTLGDQFVASLQRLQREDPRRLSFHTALVYALPILTADEMDVVQRVLAGAIGRDTIKRATDARIVL